MKKSILMIILLTTGYLLPQQPKAQIRVGININIGDQPAWRVPGYDYVEYYYLPEIESYYYVPRHQFVYLSGNNWVFSASLPARYRGYDLYHGYKVVINQPRAYLHFNQHRERYNRGNSFRRNEGQHDNGRHRGWHKRHH